MALLTVLLFGLSADASAGAYEDGFQALQGGRASDALALLEVAVADNPEHVEAWWELGWARWALEDYVGATLAWEQVERLDAAHPELYHWLGAARARAGLQGPPLKPGAPVEVEPRGETFTLAAAGDTMMGSELKKGPSGLPPGNGEGLFAPLHEILQGADVTFLNLEGPLADNLPDAKCGPKSSNCYAFRTPTRYVEALTGAGVDVVSLANNHALDLGSAGQQVTMDTLDAAGIAHAGRYGDVARLEVDGKAVAVVAAATSSCCIDVNAIEDIQSAIRQADAWADVVVFSFHGGAEGSKASHVPGEVEIAWGERRGDVKAAARAAVEAGADLVLGHGPHVLRAMEVYQGRLIAYSLGNFCGYKQFGYLGGPTGESVILEVELAENGALVSGRLHPAKIDGEGQPRPDPSGAAWRTIEQLSAEDFPETGVSVGEGGALVW